MLCAVCLSIFFSDEGRHHATADDLKRAAEGGCKICLELKEHTRRFSTEFDHQNSTYPYIRCVVVTTGNGSFIRFYPGSPVLRGSVMEFHLVFSLTVEGPEVWYTDLIEQARSDLDSRPWLVRGDAFPQKEIPSNMGHEDVLSLAKHWLCDCVSAHHCEALNGAESREWWPKRLIDLTSPAGPPRILETESERPTGRYATLSHCWGSNPTFTTLTRDNLERFRRGIPLDELPQSFKDAIHICRSLGIHYLWIDSLCILQSGMGAGEDWLLHTDVMASIYLHCLLNLSFDAAKTPAIGAFAERDPLDLQPCYVFMRANPLEKCMMDTWTAHGEVSGGCWRPLPRDNASLESVSIFKCTILLPGKVKHNTPELPLLRRGWTLQERLLSPRVLHFLRDRIAWKCGRRLFHTEPSFAVSDTQARHEATGYSAHPHFNLPVSGDCTGVESFPRWIHCIEDYSRRHLSYPESDKLAAFAAIAQRFSTTFGPSYFAGHFLSQMPGDLLWARRPRSGDAVRRKLSWSWTSVDLPIWYPLKAPPADPELQGLSEILDVQVELVDPAYKYGPVTSGQLVLRGPLMKCVASLLTKKPQLLRQLKFDLGLGNEMSTMREINVCMYLDQPSDMSIKHELYALPLVDTVCRGFYHWAQGIFLEKDPEDSERYRRTGVFHTSGDMLQCVKLLDCCRLLAGSEQVVKIV